MSKVAETAMPKSRNVLVLAFVALAFALPTPSSEASELVKLGRLIVTGKRNPAVEPKPAPAAPQRELLPLERSKVELAMPKPADGGGELNDEPNERQAEPAPSRPAPQPEPGKGMDRLGRAALAPLG